MATALERNLSPIGSAAYQPFIVWLTANAAGLRMSAHHRPKLRWHFSQFGVKYPDSISL